MAPPPESASDWYTIVGSAAVTAFASILGFITFYFKKAAEPEVTPAGTVAGKAVGAAFIDRATADVATRMADDIHHIREIADRWETREQLDERAELAELRRLAKAPRD